jgi:hypothetical protein
VNWRDSSESDIAKGATDSCHGGWIVACTFVVSFVFLFFPGKATEGTGEGENKEEEAEESMGVEGLGRDMMNDGGTEEGVGEVKGMVCLDVADIKHPWWA